jgi:hypothetical protein
VEPKIWGVGVTAAVTQFTSMQDEITWESSALAWVPSPGKGLAGILTFYKVAASIKAPSIQLQDAQLGFQSTSVTETDDRGTERMESLDPTSGAHYSNSQRI